MTGSRWLRLSLLAVLVSFSVVWSSDASAATCGVERWSVKTGTDPDAGLVNTAAVTTTSIASIDVVVTAAVFSRPASGSVPVFTDQRSTPQVAALALLDQTTEMETRTANRERRSH